MNSNKRLVEEVFSKIPSVDTAIVNEVINKELKNLNKKIIV